MKWTAELEQSLVALLSEGHTFLQISEIFGCSRSTISGRVHLRKLKGTFPNSETRARKIAESRALAAELAAKKARAREAELADAAAAAAAVVASAELERLRHAANAKFCGPQAGKIATLLHLADLKRAGHSPRTTELRRRAAPSQPAMCEA